MAILQYFFYAPGYIPGIAGVFANSVVTVDSATNTVLSQSSIGSGITLAHIQTLPYDVVDYGAKGDGVTDDTTAIQTAINAAQTAGGGIVSFPATSNFYLISSTLVVSHDNIEIVGAGWASQIQAKAGWSNGNYMLQVQGPGGAGNFRYGLRIQDIFFNGNNVTGVNGLDLVSCYGAKLDHIRVRYVPGISVHWDGISGAFGAYNFMRDCFVTDGGSAAVGVQTDSSEWLTIESCNFGYFVGGTGVAVLLQNLNNRIIANSFDNNDIAIQLSFAGRNVIVGNEFDRGHTNFIYLRGASYCVVSGNLFCGCYSGSGGNLIHVTDSGNAGNVISGNTTSNDGTNLWTNFVQEDNNAGGSPPNTYANNDVSTYPIVLHTGIARANRGYNPLGIITPPAVPASTVATSAQATDCTVYIKGGTLTDVKVSGTTTGISAAASAGSVHAVRVPAGLTISITYTVAPTWVWSSD